MRLLVDENLGLAFVNALSAAGHDVMWVVPEYAGSTDMQIADVAAQTARVIVTEDRGFPDILLARRGQSFGVILLRLSRLSEAARLHHLVQELARMPESLLGKIVVVEPGLTRINSVHSRS